jgi:drug/metabolite transporter (DMT)-like permease
VDAVLLGALAGAAFGAMALAVRRGMMLRRDGAAGGVIASAIAFVLVLIAAVAAGQASNIEDPGALLSFAIVGAAVPGLSQIAYSNAIAAAGPSRASVAVGTAPLLSSGLAVVALGEPMRPALLVGTLLVVLGGASLAWERDRPEHFAAYGIALALLCAGLFAVRDNVIRDLTQDGGVEPLVGTAASLAGATLALLGAVVVRGPANATTRLRAAARPFVPAGLLLGVAYTALFVALDRGKVTIVAPLNATQSLWAVIFAALLLRKHEQIGRRLILAAVLVVAGSALVAATR